MKLSKIVSFFIPLFFILFSLILSWQMNKLVNNYEASINNDYSIIMVSKYPIMDRKDDIVDKFDLKDIKILEQNKILEHYKNQLSKETFSMLKEQMPHFYLVYLNKFPTTNKLKDMKKKLLSIRGVYRVETFSKNHDKIYTLFLFIKTILELVFVMILLFGIVSIANQVKIWYLEESEKLEIILLLGGNILYGAKKLINSALFAAFLSAVISLFLIYAVFKNLDKFFISDVTNLLILYYDRLNIVEIVAVFVLAFILSFFTIIGVLSKIR